MREVDSLIILKFIEDVEVQGNQCICNGGNTDERWSCRCC